MNISGVGLSGAYYQGLRPVEPVKESRSDTEKGSGRQQEQLEQQEHSDQPSFGKTLEEEFMNSLPSGVCPNCGSPVYQKERGRRKIYCSDACRFEWKNRHPKPENWSSSRMAVCPICGKEFLASREYKNKRKYCSRACANTGRRKEREELSDEG